MKASTTGRDGELRKDLAAKLATMTGEQQERLARRRADELQLPYISLTVFPIDPDTIEGVPKVLAERAQGVLFYRQGRDVRIGAVNPKLPNFAELSAYVAKKYETPPQVYVISQRSLAAAVVRYRRDEQRLDTPSDELRVDAERVSTIEDAIANLQTLGAHITTLSPTELLTTIATGAVKVGASDIHIEPAAEGARLRYRIDGVLQDVTSFARSGWRLLLSRVKVMAKLKLNVKDVPQDGSFVLTIGEHRYDIRVSTLPGDTGENIVMRILDRDAEVVQIADLGMKARDEEIIQRELKKSNGMVLVTGPTGSGKTTSLAAFLHAVNDPKLKIITLENPIEYRIPGIEQTEIDDSAGYTFAKGLRAVLRQDPDIVMVGEIRDEETAATAMHAALTGHLVFSTLHTNNAPDSIVRLVDLKVGVNVLAPAINVIVAQRLVRRVCAECAKLYTPPAPVKEHIAAEMRGLSNKVWQPSVLNDPNIQFVEAVGCAACNKTGYRGRVGIFEVLPLSGAIEELVLSGANGNRIREAAIASGMTTILQDGYLKVIDHVTTIEEVERVTEE
jgi:type II secretory ATPase GspE/PulE/Tfp pilus assembly ATPase PilB-like protein